MAKKYIKCPRCELNYILEGEDYCNVCKNEMKHHSEDEYDEDLLDFDDMELCPVCGQNYVKEDQPMCDECRKKKNAAGGNGKGWEDDEMASPVSDIDSDDEDDDEYNSGFSEVDENGEEIDPFKETSLLDDDSSLDFALEDEGEIDDEIVETMKDDFEVVDVSDDDEDDEDEDDDYDFDEDDMLGKKK